MITERFLLGRGRSSLSADDLQMLENAVSGTREVPARTTLARRGEPVHVSTFLVNGYAVRYMDDRDGRRQLVAVHVPGDFIDLHGFPMRVLDHDIVTLGPATLATVEHDRLGAIIQSRPRLTRMLWFSTLLDAAMHREWIFRLGRLNAEGRVAHLFCEIAARLALVGLGDGGRFPLPFTQADVGEACGITGVHANRVLRRLREDGLLSFAQSEVAVLDPAGLGRIAEFDPAYLYGGPDGWTPRLD
jgi:CRP-like cAMP-binding protein